MIVLNMFIQCVDTVGEEEGEPRGGGREEEGEETPPSAKIQRRLGSE